MAELVRGVGDGGVNDGERRVVRKLLDELPTGWKLLPNIEIRGNRGRMLEVDCVVAAPHAVYLLEVKDWRGEIEGDDNGWVHNGTSRPSPNKQINHKAKVLKGLLGDADRQLASTAVESFVVLARTPDRLRLASGTRRHTLVMDELVPALRDVALPSGRSSSLPDLADRVARALAPLSHTRRGPRQVGNWRILETLSEDEDSTVSRVTSTLTPTAPTARMTVWHLSGYRMTDSERAEERRSVLRDFVAVRRMGPHRLVVGPIDALEDGDDVAVVTEESVGQPLAWRLASGPVIEPEVRLSWIDDLAEALAHAHKSEVIHRRVTPETVLVASDGVRLTGFAHARIEVEGTLRHDPESIKGRDARYLAPEVANRELGPATEATDMFGLAAVAWTIWAGKPLPPHWQMSEDLPPRPDDMPDALWEVVAPSLDVVPARRRVTLDEFRTAVTTAMLGQAQPMAEPPAEAPAEPLVEAPLAPAEYPVGSLIADRYEVVDKLGSGGFAIVYRAVDTEVGVERAVKVLDARAGKESGVRELLALEHVAHPHVVRVRSIDKTPTAPAQWYITSDIAPGEPLSTHCPLPLDEAVDIADQLLDACISFHPADDGGAAEAGIIHRDIKPSNVLYDRNARHATLIDFNIASRSGSTVVTMAGTPAHQPPDPDPDSWSPDPDLFGIGVLLFETLTGEHPYADGQHPASGVRSLTDLLPSAPDALSRFVDKATSPGRSDRFTSAVAMRTALVEAMEPAPFAPDDAAVDVTVPDESGSRSAMDTPTLRSLATETGDQAAVDAPLATPGGESASGNEDEPPRGGRKLAVAAVAVVVLVAAAFGGLLAMRGTEDPADSATTSESTSPPSTAPSTTASEASSPPSTAPTTAAVPAAPTEAPPSGQDCPAGFLVKGNINAEGDMIYHEAGWRYYDATRPEQCFVDGAAAEAAGFRASMIQ